MTIAGCSFPREQPAEWRLATGVFRPLLHRVDRDCRTINYGASTVCFAPCGAAAVPVPDLPHGLGRMASRVRCPACFGHG